MADPVDADPVEPKRPSTMFSCTLVCTTRTGPKNSKLWKFKAINVNKNTPGIVNQHSMQKRRRCLNCLCQPENH